MPDLKQTRNRVTVIVAALVLVDALAVGMLLSPVAGGSESRRQELSRMWLDLKSRENAPWRGLDKKIPEARQEIDAFYRDRFPGGYSAISGSLDKTAAETGVKMSSEKYEQKDADINGLQRIEIQADVSGDYLHLVKFINSLERNQLFFIVNDLGLGGEQNGIVKLQITLETYLRTA